MDVRCFHNRDGEPVAGRTTGIMFTICASQIQMRQYRTLDDSRFT
jgi:hypothetical protein